jgi:O-antigen ligase
MDKLIQHGQSPIHEAQSISRISEETQALLSFSVGLTLPAYMLDESFSFKDVFPWVTLLLVLALLLLSGYETRSRRPVWTLALVCFVLSYTASLGWSYTVSELAVNASYPLLFTALCLRKNSFFRQFCCGALIGFSLLLAIGWYRFLSGEGGSPGEHALGYWGLKYTAATRNSDALIPLFCFCSALAILSLEEFRCKTSLRLSARPLLLAALPALALSQARSAWIAAAAFAAYLIFLNPKLAGRWAVTSILIAATTLVIVQIFFPNITETLTDITNVIQRFQSIFDSSVDSSNSERARLLNYALALGLYNPIFGAGAGNFDCCFLHTGYPELVGAMHPENLIMHLWSENGILTSVSLGALLLACCTLSSRKTASADKILACASVSSLLIWLQFNSELPSMLIWIMMGFAVASASRKV